MLPNLVSFASSLPSWLPTRLPLLPALMSANARRTW